MTFEQLYAPILNAVEERQAKRSFQKLVDVTLNRSAWDNTPNNRERAEELLREEIAFIAQYESPQKAALLRRFYLSQPQIPNLATSTS